MRDEMERLLKDSAKEMSKSNRIKDRIIILLIVLMFMQAVCFFGGFVWYESQFEYVETTTEKYNQDVDLSTEGDNTSATYNDVKGNQYNDSSTHNEGGVE